MFECQRACRMDYELLAAFAPLCYTRVSSYLKSCLYSRLPEFAACRGLAVPTAPRKSIAFTTKPSFACSLVV